MEDTALNRHEQNKIAYLLWLFHLVLEVPTNTTENNMKQQG